MTAWQAMTADERKAHSARMIAEAAASRGRIKCPHGVGFPHICDPCDADQRNDYRMGAL